MSEASPHQSLSALSSDVGAESPDSGFSTEQSAPRARFFVAVDGQEFGPYDQNQILAMLQTGELTKKDLVFYEGLGSWQPIDEVFEIQEQLTHFMDEGQEPEVVVAIFNIISEFVGTGEEIYYIAHQRKKFLRSHRDVVVVTNKRIMIVKHHFASHEIDDYLWASILSVHTSEGIMGNIFAIRLSNGASIEVEDLPHAQIARLVQLSQEMRS